MRRKKKDRAKILSAALCLVALGCVRNAERLAVPEAAPGEVWLTPKQVQWAGLVVAPARLCALEAPVQCAGKLTFDDERVARVFAPVGGRVGRIEAPLGTKIAADGPLCTIHSQDLAQAVAALRGAQADRATAMRAYDRERMLFEGHAAAQKDLEAAYSAYVQAQAEHERARQKVNLLGGTGGATGDSYTLRSPLPGHVVAMSVHPGALVQGQYDAGGRDDALFVVGDIDSVWAVADVFEMDTGHIDLGDKVRVEVVAYPGQVFFANVDWVSNAVDPATRSVKVRCRLSNPEHKLKPDMFVRMTILADKKPQVVIPRAALLRHQGKTVVFVQQPQSAGSKVQRFVRREVQALEEEHGAMLAVLGGLAVGEQVVSHGGAMLLKD